MEINQKFEFVEGVFDTETDELICFGNNKYGEVKICVKSGIHIPIAKIKLHSRDMAVDADAVYDDAYKLGQEICRRWNECETKK